MDLIGLLLVVALPVVAYLSLKRRITGKETPEDLKSKSMLGAAGAGPMPRFFGVQSSTDLPEGFAPEEIGPSESNVYVMDAKRPTDELVEPAPKKPIKKKKKPVKVKESD